MLIYTFIFYFARLLIDVGRNNRSDHRIDMDDKQISDNCKKVSKKMWNDTFFHIVARNIVIENRKHETRKRRKKRILIR